MKDIYDYNKIIIIGPCGSGKSTLSFQLEKMLNLPTYHLDCIYWRANWEHITREEFEQKQNDIMSHEKWIIDGTYFHTLNMRVLKADLVIYLDFNLLGCYFRAKKRAKKHAIRLDMAEGCQEKFDHEFSSYILKFNLLNKKKILSLLDSCTGDVLRFKSPRQMHKYFMTYEERNEK